MEKPTLIISDLHLEESRPELTSAFLDFVEKSKNHCSRLFILGDLFEAWIGDDDDSALADSVARQLNALAATGVEIGLMHGNRDFLLGEQYAARCGARLMEESEIITSGSDRFLLMHGDSLCTDDVSYQAFRTMVRQPEWQAQFLSQSLEDRRAFATQARTQSKIESAAKNNDIMDVNANAVASALTAAGVTQLIHGHTHRPASHQLKLLDEAGEQSVVATRTVLGDWGATGWQIKLQGNKLSLIEFNI